MFRKLGKNPLKTNEILNFSSEFSNKKWISRE